MRAASLRFACKCCAQGCVNGCQVGSSEWHVSTETPLSAPGRMVRSLRTLEKTEEDGERKFAFEKSTVNVKHSLTCPPR